MSDFDYGEFMRGYNALFGKIEPEESPRAKTKEEVAIELSDHFMLGICDYWATVDGDYDEHYRLDGMIHSLLSAFDGTSGGMCAIDISHPEMDNSTSESYMNDMVSSDELTGVNDCERLLLALRKLPAKVLELDGLSLTGKGLAMVYCILNGFKEAGCKLELAPHPEDEEFWRERGRNWFGMGQEVNVDLILAEFRNRPEMRVYLEGGMHLLVDSIINRCSWPIRQ